MSKSQSFSDLVMKTNKNTFNPMLSPDSMLNGHLTVPVTEILRQQLQRKIYLNYCSLSLVGSLASSSISDMVIAATTTAMIKMLNV